MPHFHPSVVAWNAPGAPPTDKWCGTCFAGITTKLVESLGAGLFLAVVVDGNDFTEAWNTCLSDDGGKCRMCYDDRKNCRRVRLPRAAPSGSLAITVNPRVPLS